MMGFLLGKNGLIGMSDDKEIILFRTGGSLEGLDLFLLLRKMGYYKFYIDGYNCVFTKSKDLCVEKETKKVKKLVRNKKIKTVSTIWAR